VSATAHVEEGGGFGFGRFRSRYQHADANNDCAWGDYILPEDSWQLDPPLPVEDFDPGTICITLDIDKNIFPDQFYLNDNYPNPFNPITSISFGLSSSAEVKINIYNILGQRIVEFNKGRLEAGSYNYLWNGENKIGENVTSGIYFYEMKAGDKFREIKKMTLVK